MTIFLMKETKEGGKHKGGKTMLLRFQLFESSVRKEFYTLSQYALNYVNPYIIRSVLHSPP